MCISISLHIFFLLNNVLALPLFNGLSYSLDMPNQRTRYSKSQNQNSHVRMHCKKGRIIMRLLAVFLSALGGSLNEQC